jgi:hypothetical protein
LVTVLPLPGLVKPSARPALARRVSTVGQIEKPGNIDALVAELRIAARSAAATSRAKSTERAYGNDWRDFCAFAHLIGRAPHPAEAETVALYVTDLARRGRAPATIARRLVSIAVYHRAAAWSRVAEHDGPLPQLGTHGRVQFVLEVLTLRGLDSSTLRCPLVGCERRKGFDAQSCSEGPSWRSFRTECLLRKRKAEHG